MIRHLFIVSRKHPELYEYLITRFQDDANVQVVMDRRERERRAKRPGPYHGDDRRSGERRQAVPDGDDLDHRSHRIVTLDDGS